MSNSFSFYALEILIRGKIIDYLNDTVQAYMITEGLSNDFNWLAENDSVVCQELKNAFLQKEKEVISECTLQRIQVILQYFNNSGTFYSSVKQTLRIGRHEIVLKSDSSHINWEQPKVSETSQKNSKNPLGNFIEGNWGCLLVIMIIIFFSIW